MFLHETAGLHRECALKVLMPERVLEEPETLERFLFEARSAAQLVHPHIEFTYTETYPARNTGRLCGFITAP